MNKDEKTLIILIPGFPKDEADSTCLPMQQQFILSLKELYPQLEIIILSLQYPYFKKMYHWFGITVISYDGRNRGGWTKWRLRQKLKRELKILHQSKKIIGLLSFWYGECAYVGKRFADKYGLKHYCWLMGQDAKKENRYPGRLHLRSNELIALSDFLQDELERNHGLRPQHVIPPGITVSPAATTETRKDIDILAAGSLIPLKQYAIFLEVIAEIKKQIPAIKAVLIGDGPEKKKLQDIIARYGLQSTVILTGELSHVEVLQQMERARVFLHPSSYEGFGVVMIEALQTGCRVISFCKPMNKDIEHWHIVTSPEEMKHRALQVLKEPGISSKRVTPFLLNDTSKKIMMLFGEKQNGK